MQTLVYSAETQGQLAPDNSAEQLTNLGPEEVEMVADAKLGEERLLQKKQFSLYVHNKYCTRLYSMLSVFLFLQILLALNWTRTTL